MFTRYLLAMAVATCLANAANAAEEETPKWNEDTLTGDWGGTRAELHNKGIDFEFTHKSDVLSTRSGGIERGTAWLGNTEAVINMDLGKLWGWDATSASINYHSQLGSKFDKNYVGSFMGVDNIEAGVNSARFFQAWVQKNFSDDSFSVLAGLYAIDSEFYVTDTSGIFLQPPYGMANDLAQTGQAGPPVFPVGALAIRLKYTSPGKNCYAQYALTDGVPGDPNDPYGTHIKLNKGDGSLSIAEFGYTPQDASTPVSKTAIGFWRYTSRFDDLDPAIVNARHVNHGAYFLAEHTLFNEKDNPAHGLSGFVRFGTASKDVNAADWAGSFGLRYQGLISGRDDDTAGISVNINHASDKNRLLNNLESSEKDVEITYRAQIKPWFALQPMVQYIVNPSMDPTRKNIWIVGARAEVNF